MPPNEYSNFTQPDPNMGTPKKEPGQGDHGEVWNPSGGPDGQGAWEQPKDQYSSTPTMQKGRWGNQGNNIDANGQPIEGTSGADVDRDRYLGMREGGAKTPVIDQGVSDQAKGIGMGGLDLMRRTAEGNSPSVAERMGTKLAGEAANARTGMAASVRGGAAARAGAARGAVADRSTIMQQQAASNVATRAGEMAQARGAYFGGANAMRGQDLGLAGSQADLEAQNRKAADDRAAFYENKAHDVQKADVMMQQGMNAQEQTAANTAMNQQAARDKAASDNDKWLAGTGVAIGQGAASGWGSGSTQEQPGQKPPDPDIANSDERTKKDMKPVSDRVAARLKAKARGMIDETNAQREGFGLGKDPVSDDPNGQPGDPLNGYIPREREKGPTYGGPRKGTLTNEDTGDLGGFKREIGSGISDAEAARLQAAAAGMQDQTRAQSEGQLGNGPSVGKKSLVSDIEAAKLKKQAGEMMAHTDAQRQGFGLSTVNTPGNESAGRGEIEEAPPRERIKKRTDYAVRNMGKPTWGTNEDNGGPSPELQEAMRKAVEDEAAPKPENPHERSLFGNAPKGYASGRAGERGGMFGEHLAGAPTIREENRVAPGTRDFMEHNKNNDAMGNPKDPYSSRIMMSDARAKQQAFQDGANWSLNGGEGGVPRYMPGTVDSQGGAKRADSPVHGKDSTNQAAIDEYPSDPSKRTPEDRAKVAQLHQFVNDNEGDAFDRANVPGQGPPAAPLNPREGTELQGVPRTSVANDMRKRTREYATSQDRDETPEQRTARFLKKSQDRKAQEKGAESAPSSPSKTSEGETPDERTQRFLKKSQDTSRPGAPAKWDTSSKVGPRSSGEEKPSILPKFMQPGQKIPGKLGEKLDAAGKRLTGPSAADEQRAEQDAQIHSNQLLTDKLQNLQAQGDINTDRKRLEEAGITSSDEKSKRDMHFGGPMAAANRAMKPMVYEYKPEFAEREHQPVGDKNVGPMAQNMDKDPIASTVIVHDPDTGLMGIDKSKGLKLVMGGLSDLQRQVDELHGKKKGRKA